MIKSISRICIFKQISTSVINLFEAIKLIFQDHFYSNHTDFKIFFYSTIAYTYLFVIVQHPKIKYYLMIFKKIWCNIYGVSKVCQIFTFIRYILLVSFFFFYSLECFPIKKVENIIILIFIYKDLWLIENHI